MKIHKGGHHRPAGIGRPKLSADQNKTGREKSQRVYVVLLKAKERLCSSHMGNYENLKVNGSMKYHLKED